MYSFSLIKIYNQAKKFKHIHFLTKEEYYMVIELGALAILQRNINAFINFLLFYNLILLSVTLSNFITINTQVHPGW